MKYKIYDKEGNVEKAEVKELEYNGVYEGERYVTVKTSSPYPVDFKIGDKLTFRDEVFTLRDIQSIRRNARNYQSGKSIEYDGLRFFGTASDLYDIQFCDYVLNDNNLPYTGLGTFSFYVSKAEDFGSRIQANLDLNYGEGKWHVEYGKAKDINKAKIMSIGSDTNLYDALVQFSNDYEVNFIIKGYTITIGFVQESTEYEYFFGKGHGLTSLEVTTDSNQRVVTRLKAYGSQRNIPYLYYTNLGKEYVVKVKSAQKYTSANVRLVLSIDLGLDFDENDSLFTNGVDIDTNTDWRNYKIKVRAGDTEAVAIIECHTSSSLQPANQANIYIGLDYSETDSKIVDKIIEYFEGISSYPTDLYITEGYNSKKVPYENTFIPPGVPNNMSVKNLMLPGFPDESLYDWAMRVSKETTETGRKVLALINEGFDFSKNKYLPYITSPKVNTYGIKDGEVIFDGSDEKWDEIYPSLKGMTTGELSTISGYEGSLTFKGSGEVDRILSGSTISDNGVSSDGTYGDGSKDTGGVLMYASFEITIPNIGFNPWDYKADGETPVIHMQDGMCAGRSFEILKCIPVNVDDIKKGYRLNLQRELDQSVNMYYPNRIYNISAGDKFVLEGIEMPDVYIEAASVRLLFQSIEKLRDIDYLKKTYKPEIDNIFMARNPNYAENLYEGIKMCIADDDLGIVAITISQLNIKETEGEIPKYEVTLDDESTAELLSLNIATGNATGNQQSTGQSIKLIRTNDDTTPTNRNAFSALRSLEEFLNKISPDTALEVITFLKGLLVGDGEYGIDADGIAQLKKLLSDEATIKTLTVTGRAHFFELIIDELNSVGGQLIMSGANCTVRSVERISGAWRLWWLAEDSDGRAVQNMWKVGDQALSMTSNLAEGTSYDTGNRFWWRLVTATGSGTRNIDGEDRKCHWIEVSEATCAADSVEPAEGDSVCLCGHRGDDTARCHAIIIAAHSTPDTGLECPSIAQYNGITSFSLSQYRTTWFAANGNKIRGELDVDTSGLMSYTHLAWSNSPDDWTKDKLQSTAKDWLMLGICTDRTESDVNLVYSDYAWSRIKGTDGKDGTSFTVKGSVDDESMLPPTGNSTGDAYLVNGYLWVWDGSAWANAGKIQGPAGEDGADGKTTYFHIRYSPNPDGVPMSETPDVFIGTRVDFNPTASDVPSDYTWSRFQGYDGEQGIPGTNGADGKTSYLHIKYSDDGGKTFTANNGETPGAWIGQCVDFNSYDPTSVTSYKWTRIRGEDGADGSDGFGYSFSPANISMETNENGVVGTGNASATLSAYFGEQKATVTINSITTTNCSATKNGATITITSVKTYNYNGKTIPYSAGFININATATLNGRTQSFTARLDFSVSIMKYAAKLSVEQDNITSTVTKISQDQEELSGSVSEIKQTADNISLKVDRLNITDGNMIENSDIFLRGIAGNTNKGYIIGDFSSWRGKTITVSCLIKTVNASANGNNRMGLEPTIYFKDGTRQFLGLWYYIGSNNTTEQRISKAFQIGDKEIEKIEQQTMYIQGLTSGYASVSRPKIEMGDTSTAWGLSEAEKEKKVNLLEDTATFGGATINGTIQKNAYTTEYGEVIDVLQSESLAAGGEYIDVVRWNYVLTPEAGVQYTLSFWAKGTGEIRSYLAANVCDWVLGETKNEVGVSDGYIAFQLTSGWKRYSVTWSTRTDTSGVKNLIPVRLMPNSSSASQVSVCGVRFEKGSVATPWRGKPATDTNLLATGIDINNKKVIITSDNFEIRNNSGEVTTTVDEDGTLTGVTLETRDYGFGHIKMTNGLMEIYNPQGIMNAKFGFNGTYITLSFYDNDGNLRYDLSPSGLSGADLVQEAWITDSSTYGLILTGDFEDIISNAQLLDRLFTANYKWPAHTYYRYIAGKVGESYVQGDYASTAEIAQGANDNWFSEKADVTTAATPIGSFVALNTNPFYVVNNGTSHIPTDYTRYESSYAWKVNFKERYCVKTIWRFYTLRVSNPVGSGIKIYGCKLAQYNVYMNLSYIHDWQLQPITDTENEPDP